jgi:ubiquinone/menaquinone biosynthesis C-methylase UbiE
MEKLKSVDNEVRPADEAIYLRENRYQEPKEIFKEIVKGIRSRVGNAQGKTFLDVGCATGEFVWYLKSQFPGASFSGIDVSSSMVNAASNQLPDCRFNVGSVLNAEDFEDSSFDVVTCSGVLPLFDDQAVPISNLVRCLKPDGLLVIYTLVNDDPVDMVMRYRDVRDSVQPWQSGWNVFSKISFEAILSKIDHKLQWKWVDFLMPFDIPKGEDPMRTWTTAVSGNPTQLVNGAGQLINGKILYINKMVIIP